MPVAFSLAYEVIVDPTDGANFNAQNRAAILYFFDTFLPARGVITNSSEGTSGTVKRGWATPSYDINHGDAVTYDYHWASIPEDLYTLSGGAIRIYEDGTYNSVPGDKMSSTRNSINWYVVADDASSSSNDPYTSATWKFWTSDEDNSLYLLTRGNKVLMWGGQFRRAYVYPNSDYADVPGTDRYRTHFFPSCNEGVSSSYGKTSNLPHTSNTSSTEYVMGARTPHRFAEPKEFTLQRNWQASTYEQSNANQLLVDLNDIRLAIPEAAQRSTSYTITTQYMSYDAYKLQDGTDWWIGLGAPTSMGLAFYFGTTEPDLS